MVFTLGLRHTAVVCSSLPLVVESLFVQLEWHRNGGVVKTFRCTTQMRLTPAQVGMSLLIDGCLPTYPEQPRVEGMARGLQMLRRVSGTDFGYDLRAWHDHLIETDAGGYKWSNFHRSFPKRIDRAMADAEWQAATENAVSTDLCDELTARDNRQRDAQHAAELEWSGKTRSCPKCQSEFTSVQDKGQCPNCRHMFYASHPESGNEMWWLAIP